MGSKSLAMICLAASITMGCDYLDRPKTVHVAATVGDHSGIAYGGIDGFLSATLANPRTECIPYQEFVKVGDTTKAVWRYKLVLSTEVRLIKSNRELWPFAPPKGTVRYELLSPTRVVLAAQEIEHTFLLDDEKSQETAVFSGLTEADLERVARAELSWRYNR